MAKKTAKEVQEQVKQSANKIWLAGLGALSVAEQEGGKLFHKLVKKGETYEARGKKQLDSVKGKVEKAAGSAKERAGEVWEKVEDAWDERVASTLHRIGVPSKDEISHLTRRVEELTRMVAAKKPAARRRAPATKRKAG
ncbi:MAG: phasin family protein [Thermoanaerobaculia bacterium]